MPFYRYRKSHCEDKTIWQLSYLHNGISFTGKMTSLYWIRAQNVYLSYPAISIAIHCPQLNRSTPVDLEFHSHGNQSIVNLPVNLFRDAGVGGQNVEAWTGPVLRPNLKLRVKITHVWNMSSSLLNNKLAWFSSSCFRNAAGDLQLIIFKNINV